MLTAHPRCFLSLSLAPHARSLALRVPPRVRSATYITARLGNRLSASATYRSSVRLMVGWNVLITALILGGSAWRMTALTWYHFLPAVVLAAGSFALNMSTLVY